MYSSTTIHSSRREMAIDFKNATIFQFLSVNFVPNYAHTHTYTHKSRIHSKWNVTNLKVCYTHVYIHKLPFDLTRGWVREYRASHMWGERERKKYLKPIEYGAWGLTLFAPIIFTSLDRKSDYNQQKIENDRLMSVYTNVIYSICMCVCVFRVEWRTLYSHTSTFLALTWTLLFTSSIHTHIHTHSNTHTSRIIHFYVRFSNRKHHQPMMSGNGCDIVCDVMCLLAKPSHHHWTVFSKEGNDFFWVRVRIMWVCLIFIV